MNILIGVGIILLLIAFIFENFRGDFYKTKCKILEDYANELEKIIQGLKK
jgi:hypothetical protein